MLARVRSCATVGIEGLPVEVEADIGVGLPVFSIVGLPDAAVRESRERVLAAVRNCGFEFPARRITINLAPAHVRKEGARFDLPIAVALLLASGQIPKPPALERALFVGELALDGTVRPTRGILAVLAAAHRGGLGPVWLPQGNVAEARAIRGVAVQALGSLRELRGEEAVEGEDGAAIDADRRDRDGATAGDRTTGPAPAPADPPPDLADIRGQATARRALEIAAAGGHNLLLIGPPGVGKTMLARRLPGILPPLDEEAAVEATTIHSVAGRLEPGAGLLTHPPFRAPHHTISTAGLMGGGRGPMPGEASLAHAGVLFLDELPEFRRDALEALRQPLEDGFVVIARAGGSVRLPARFALVAAMNPCPCGYRGDPRRECRCAPEQIARYWSKISGPILDRIDLVVETRAPSMEELLGASAGETSAEVRARVLAVREAGRTRANRSGEGSGSGVTPGFSDALGPACRALLAQAERRFALSARGLARVRRVARTIADLERSPDVAVEHLAEALRYRHPGQTGPGSPGSDTRPR